MKIAFIPLDGYGHVNACIGLAQVCLERGHQIYFIINQAWSGRLSPHGFVEKVYTEVVGEHDTHSSINDYFLKFSHTLKLNSFDKIRAFEAPGWPTLFDGVKHSHPRIKQFLRDIKPDVIIVDHLLSLPSVITAGVPWINLISCSRLFHIDDQRLPPGGSGYATYGDKLEWKRFRDEQISAYKDTWMRFNSWIQTQGVAPLETGVNFMNESPYLNLYLCPKELDYSPEIYPEFDHWRNVDSLIRTHSEQKFLIPKSLTERYDKLIYVSMGTFACSDLSLMRRLIDILSKSENAFVVSKGPFGDELVLADNMCGQCSVNQLQVLQSVDLVITHGGNNTVTESLYYGKPMIVMPVFSDQYDNAQRIHEKRLGIRMDPYNCTHSQLLDAINNILVDKDLKLRVETVSKRIQSSQSIIEAIKLIEKL